MALFYTLMDYNNGTEGEWHVGQDLRQLNEYGRTCVDLQADGHELEVIREQFTGIPMASGRVVRWKGDNAAFIAMNIRNK